MLIKIGDCFVNPDEIAAVRDMFLPANDEQPTVEIILRGGACFDAEASIDEAEAALIDAGCIDSPYPEDGLAAPALSDNERIELEALDAQGYEYIARDADGKLYAYKGEPGREGGYYYATGASTPEKVNGDFLCVDTDEAWSISFLLGE
jgi:hypothetical protein